MDTGARSRPSSSPVPRELLDRAETLTDAVASLATHCPDFECLVFVDRHGSERSLTPAGLWSRAVQVQAALLARGLRPGHVALLTLPTGPELVSAYLGIMRAGGIPGLVAPPSNRFADPRLYAAYLEALLRQADARVLYCDAEVAKLLPTGGAPGLERTIVVTPHDASRAGPCPGPLAAAPGDIATVQYSSGSTGAQKGVLLSHRAMLNNIRAVRDGLRLTRADVSVNWIPLYHDMGLIDAFLLPLLSGCRTVLIPTMDFMREPALWLRAIHRHGGTLSWAPNFAYALCATRVPESELTGLDLSGWRIAINAAEPVLARTVGAFTERFAAYGFRPEAMTPAWGLAENVTIATAHPVDEPPRIEAIDRQAVAAGVARAAASGGLPSVAIGRCLPGCEVHIRDAHGSALPDRQVGQVWLRSNSLFASYYSDPAATAHVLIDGWLDTGDRGYTIDGHLYFISRDKDLIVIGGEKYAPHDVETAIDRIPGVRQGCVVVFGVLNEMRGTEDVAAVVETRETDDQAQQELRDAIRAEVTRITGLGLRHVILVPPGGVEKTTSGKLARRATQRRYAELLGG